MEKLSRFEQFSVQIRDNLFFRFLYLLNKLFYKIEKLLHFEMEGRTVTRSTWL